MKVGAILCIVDGMTDEGFEYDCCPTLVQMKTRSAYGLIQTTPHGFSPESYPCIATVLGVPCDKIPRHARGYLEALGLGIRTRPDDLILRGSWVELDSCDRIVAVTCAPHDVCVPEGVEYYEIGTYKSLIVLRGRAGLVDSVTTYPPHENMGRNIEEMFPLGCNELSELVMRNRRGKGVLVLWGQSVFSVLPTFKGRAALVGSASIIKGMAEAMSMDVYDRQDFTGDTDTSLDGKVDLAMKIAREYDLVVLHVNGADEAAHRKDVREKRRFLKRMDSEVVFPLMASSHRVMVCSDHGTSPSTGEHIGTPQPFVISGNSRLKGDLGEVCGTRPIEFLLEGQAR